MVKGVPVIRLCLHEVMQACIYEDIAAWEHANMQTIVINSQKGGSGKTMLCKNLSVEAERVGDGPVFLIDTDPQGTLTAWHAKRDSEKPARIEVGFDQIEKGLNTLRKHGAAYCIVDTASGRLEIAAELFKFADLVVFPVQPSEDDLTAAPVTVQALKHSKTPFVFVLTRVRANTLITAQAAAVLSKHGQVAETFVNDRTGYKAPYASGQTIAEAEPKGPAAKEITALWQNIKTCLHASMQAKEGDTHA
jgi:chromosome partitioning protein